MYHFDPCKELIYYVPVRCPLFGPSDYLFSEPVLDLLAADLYNQCLAAATDLLCDGFEQCQMLDHLRDRERLVGDLSQGVLAQGLK